MAVEVGLLLEFLDVVAVAARVHLPVDRGEVVARHVLAVLRELDAEALEGAAVKPGQEAFDDRARFQLECAQARDHGRIEELACARELGHRLHPASRQRHGLEEALDDRVGVDPLRLGVEVRHDAVAQDRLGAPGCP